MRAAKQVVVIGTNGTGKTTYLKQLAADAIKRGERVLVVTKHFNEWLEYAELPPTVAAMQNFKGGARLLWRTNALELVAHFRGGLLIFDDCRRYFALQTSQQLEDLMIARRQNMVDIVAVGHGFTRIPPAFFTYTTDIVLFRTLDSIYSRKNDLINFEKTCEAQARVNEKAKAHPHYYEIVKQ